MQAGNTLRQQSSGKAPQDSRPDEGTGGWLQGAASSTWGIIKGTAGAAGDRATGAADLAGRAVDRATAAVAEAWNKSGNLWVRTNGDGSVSKAALVDGAVTIPPLDEFNWGWSGDSAESLWGPGGATEPSNWQKFGWDWSAGQSPAPLREAGNKVDKAGRCSQDSPESWCVRKQCGDGSSPEAPGGRPGSADDWRRDGGDRHTVTDDRGEALAEIRVKDGQILRLDRNGARTEVTREFVRHEAADGQKLLINKKSGDVLHENADGTVVHSRNGERFRHVDKKRGIIVDGDGRTVYIVQKDERRRIRIDQVLETIELVEGEGAGKCARLSGDRERLVYTLEQPHLTFHFVQDRQGNQYFQDEQGTRYWRSHDGKQTVRTAAGAIYRHDPSGLRLYRTATGLEYIIGDDGSVTPRNGGAAVTGRGKGGDVRLDDGAVTQADGTLLLADGTRIDRQGTVVTWRGHRATRLGKAIFRDGQVVDAAGFHHRDGTSVSRKGELTLAHGDGSVTTYKKAAKVLSLADGTEIDRTGTTTASGTRLRRDHSLRLSDGTAVASNHAIIFADGTSITADGRVSTPDGWFSDANLYHHGIEFTSEKAAEHAVSEAAALVSSLMPRIQSGSITFAEVDNLFAALGDLGILSRIFTQLGKLSLVQSLLAAQAQVQGALTLGLRRAQHNERQRRRTGAQHVCG